MAQLVYLDETGSPGTRASGKQPLLTLAAVVVSEDQVQPLAEAMRDLAMKHHGDRPKGFEFHGYEVWHGSAYWKGYAPEVRAAAYLDVIGLLKELDIWVAYSSIHKQRLTERYGGGADDNVYQLALQFLLEKVDGSGGTNRIVIADEHQREEVRAKEMVTDMQQYGSGVVPGPKLRTLIDSLHFVSSHESPGVQLADMVAFVIQRGIISPKSESHPDAQATLNTLAYAVQEATRTWREPWP